MIPEVVFRRSDYEHLLAGIYRDLAQLDSDGILQREWIHTRACIARSDHMALEIRSLDVHERPRTGIAIPKAAAAAVQAQVQESWVSLDPQQAWNQRELEEILLSRGHRA